MIITVLRTIIIYFTVVLSLRLMGKRQIGELEASELVVTIIISEIAALPITDSGAPLAGNILAILILLTLEIVLSYLAYRFVPIRVLLCGKPSTFFCRGKLYQKEMEKQRFSLGDLMEEIRGSGATGLSQVDSVIMETNGRVSVILRGEHSPVTPQDLNIPPGEVCLSYVLIDNGHLIRQNLTRFGLNDIWLKQRLSEYHVRHIRDVYYMSVEQGSLKTILIPKEASK